MIKKLFSHSLIYGLSPQIPRIASVFALPITTPHLRAIDYGVFGLITAISEGLSILSTLGLNVTLSNSYYRSPGQYKWAWRQVYGFLILWNLLYAAILTITLYWFIPKEAQENTWLIILLNVLPLTLFGPSSILGRTYYQLHQRPFQIASRNIVIGLLTVGLNVYFIAGLKLGYLGWFMSVAISQIFLQASYFIPLIRSIKITAIFNFKWRFIREKLKIGLPTVPHYYGGYLLNTSDRVIMSVLGVSISSLGLYSAANTVGNLVRSAAVASGQAIGPMLSQAYRNGDENQARQLVFVLQACFLIGTFLLGLWMKEIFEILIKNEELKQVYPLGVIIVMAYNYRPMYYGANNRLFYLEKTKSLPKITLVAGLLSVLLNLIFIPIFGFQAAAYTTFLTLMYMGYSGYYLKDFKEHCKIKYYPIFWFFVTVILTIIAYLLVEIEPLQKLLISLIFIGISVGLFSRVKNVVTASLSKKC